MSASLGQIEATEARWWVTEAMVIGLIGRLQARGDAPLTVADLAAELAGMLPPGATAEDRELVLPQLIGRLRDLADAGAVCASADFSEVLPVRVG